MRHEGRAIERGDDFGHLNLILISHPFVPAKAGTRGRITSDVPDSPGFPLARERTEYGAARLQIV
jgi:hypothetical protein